MNDKDLDEKFKNIKIEDSNIFTLNELVLAFEYFKKTRDQYIKENKLDKAKVEQEKINIIVNDERLEQLFKDNEFGYSRIGDIDQVIKDREILWPLILR
jgi:hypothetical protein